MPLDQNMSKGAVSPALQCDITVYKLGGVELPYVGYGALEYNSEEHEWIVEFAAPYGWDCTNLGWSFPAGDDVPIAPADGETVWRATGVVDALVIEDVLYLSVWTDDAIHDFEFVYAATLADAEFTFVQGDERLESRAGSMGAHPAEDKCPGGTCECTGKCKACCSAGFHPRCSCSSHGTCSCIKNKKETPVDPLLLLCYALEIP
jgi:hypothetical protein